MGRITWSGIKRTKIHLEVVHIETRAASSWIITRRYKENVKTYREGVSVRAKNITHILFVFANGRLRVALTRGNTCIALSGKAFACLNSISWRNFISLVHPHRPPSPPPPSPPPYTCIRSIKKKKKGETLDKHVLVRGYFANGPKHSCPRRRLPDEPWPSCEPLTYAGS